MNWIAVSPLMRDALEKAKRFARKGSVVLIGGETGTGKSALGQFIHEHSPRGESRKPLAVVDGTFIHQEDLWHSMAFGHTRGSFTGALEDRPGRLVAANGGTVVLEEIGELSLSLQSKLLRFLDNGEVFPLGKDDPVRTDVRIIAATNRDLWQMVQAETFREDLFYRLSVLEITMPALRDRPEDVEALIKQELDVRRKTITKDALHVLLNHHWSGNVRELLNVMERVAVLSEKEVQLEHIPPRLLTGSGRKEWVKHPLPSIPRSLTFTNSDGFLPRPLAEIEREYVLAALDYHGGDKKAAASSLGISLKTIYNRLSDYRTNGSTAESPS